MTSLLMNSFSGDSSIVYCLLFIVQKIADGQNPLRGEVIKNKTIRHSGIRKTGTYMVTMKEAGLNYITSFSDDTDRQAR